MSSALNTAEQQSEGGVWTKSSCSCTCLSHQFSSPFPVHFLIQAFTFLLPEILDASVSSPLLPLTPRWKKKHLDVWVPRGWLIWVPCQSWLLYSGSKLSNRLLTANNPLCLRGAFLLGNCECFARVSLLVFPATQWGMKMAEGDRSSSLLLAREQTQVAYFEAVLQVCISAGLPSEVSQNWLQLGVGMGVGERPGRTVLSPGTRAKILHFLFQQSILENGLWWIIHQSNWSWTSFVETTGDLTMYSPFSFSFVLFLC